MEKSHSRITDKRRTETTAFDDDKKFEGDIELIKVAVS
jgi:hypothetical protein